MWETRTSWMAMKRFPIVSYGRPPSRRGQDRVVVMRFRTGQDVLEYEIRQLKAWLELSEISAGVMVSPACAAKFCSSTISFLRTAALPRQAVSPL